MRTIYLSPLGWLITLFFLVLGRFFRPFMIYGFWNHPTKSIRRMTRISSSTVLVGRSGINIGESCWIGPHCILDGSNSLTIGEGVQIAGLAGIFTHSSHVSLRLHGASYIRTPADSRVGYCKGAVSVGAYSFIGTGAVILPGVTIGRACVIAAGAVVTRSVPDFSVVAGVPAKVIASTLDEDRKYFDDPYVREHYFARDIIETHVAALEQAKVESGVTKSE